MIIGDPKKVECSLHAKCDRRNVNGGKDYTYFPNVPGSFRDVQDFAEHDHAVAHPDCPGKIKCQTI